MLTNEGRVGYKVLTAYCCVDTNQTHKNVSRSCLVWRYISVMAALERLKQGDCNFEASLGFHKTLSQKAGGGGVAESSFTQ